MHVLRPYVERIEGLTGLVTEAAGNTVTQGVVLDVNPIWLLAYRFGRAGLRPFFFDFRWEFHGLAPLLLLEQLVSLETIEGDAIDFGWVDKTGWVQEVMYRSAHLDKPIPEFAMPFLVKIIAKPVNSNFFESREQLVALASRQNFFAIVETRPLGRLVASAGDACLAGGVPGTVGGFLRDQKSKRVYAATCGHVAAVGATVTVSGTHLGTCSHSQPPRPLPVGQSCTQGCPSANRLDLALIDVGKTTVKNKVTAIASQIASHQSLVLRGGMTKVNTFEAGGLMLTYCPGLSNVCFENMFEVRPPSPGGILSPRVRSAFATVPTQGDSGGWLETTGGEWCGVLVAADHLMGYALEADDTLAEADAVFGTRLQLA
jgi:hypothetical protein